MPRKRAVTLTMMVFALGMAAEKHAVAQTKTNSTVSASNPSSPQPFAHTNRLAREKSPYLLQHAHNPV
ncbi:MAG TPA: hypothetical protein VFB72_07580, partial [Verrucomicrobiae bacterium]|nr:hypothetical protein [Verrucomicrobiae bacterium]